MSADLHKEITKRLLNDYEFKEEQGWLRAGKCPSCGKKELYTHAEHPWVLRCGRLSKCGSEWHVKELYSDLFESWSDRYQKTPENPNAAADAYMQSGRGFDLQKVRGWYTQESFYDHRHKIGSATVRFTLAQGVSWERIIDKPGRFGSQKANFIGQYGGMAWSVPGLDSAGKAIWIVEGIFDAIALHHHGIYAIAAMSSGNYPSKFLEAIALQCTSNDKPRPTLVWALDGDKAGQTGIKKFVERSRKDGWTATAAMIPQKGRNKLDWNDMHQRGRLEAEHLEEYLYQGSLLIAESAASKALLMYQRHGYPTFDFTFDNRMFWFKWDEAKFSEQLKSLRENQTGKSEEEMRKMAGENSGTVTEIANCSFNALYYQANRLTDESWYYFRVDFPHDGPSVKNTFTGSQVSAAGEFKKRLLSLAPGAFYTGNSAQLDRILRHQLGGIQTVETIDFIGYSKDHGVYVFNDFAVKGGRVYEMNGEDFYEVDKLSIKSLNQSVRLDINTDLSEFKTTWLNDLHTCFGGKGLTALTFWLGTLFVEQIRDLHKSYPFLEVVGEPGAGKTTLLEFLWKLCGRVDYEGFDPSKSTMAARTRNFAQVANLPIALIEGDRGGEDTIKQKGFDWDEMKTAYNGRSVRATGMKNGGNDTKEPPFRGAVMISQNAPVQASDAVIQRICHLYFDVASHSSSSKAAADRIERMPVEQVSGFILKAVKMEKELLDVYAARTSEYEKVLSSSREIKNFRIIKNHAQLMALSDALRLVLPQITDTMHGEILDTVMDMAVERQKAINADHPTVQAFWDIYEFLESSDVQVVNHSKDPTQIAINLNHFAQVAADKRQQLPPLQDLKGLLKTSRKRKFLGLKPVNSAINDSYNARKIPDAPSKPQTVKCWCFDV